MSGALTHLEREDDLGIFMGTSTLLELMTRILIPFKYIKDYYFKIGNLNLC